MDAKIITVYAVNQGDDDKYSGKPEWIYTDKAKADSVARGRGWYGGNAPVSKRDAVAFSDGSVVLCELGKKSFKLNYGPDEMKAEKDRLIRKLNEALTPVEQEMLGINVKN